jgi:hypothetical protein
MCAALPTLKRSFRLDPPSLQPNEGDYTTEGLSARLRSNAADNIFTTVFGGLTTHGLERQWLVRSAMADKKNGRTVTHLPA